MRSLRAIALLAALATSCSSNEHEAPPLALTAADATCAAQCSELELVGSLVKLSPASRSVAAFTQLARIDGGWAVAWHNEAEKAAYLQRIDESGVPLDGAFRVRNAQALAPHWDGASLSLWTQIYDQDVQNAGLPRSLAFARFDGELSLLESALLSGPEGVASFIAYDFAGTSAFAYTTGRVSLPVRQLRMLPGPRLEQTQHLLERASDGYLSASLAWTGKQIAATYASAEGYRTTFLDPTTLAETNTVNLGPASGERPQDIQSAMGDTLLWVAVWEMSNASFWLRAIDVATGTAAGAPIHLPWTGTLTSFTTVGDTPLVISRPTEHVLGEPENDAIVPIDAASQRACAGMRFGRANVVDLELNAGQGAALLDDQQLYFARVRCKP